MAHRFLISHDSPALYITIVTKDRLPVFRTDWMREFLCPALDEARKSAKILIFAYAIMCGTTCTSSHKSQLNYL